MRALEVVEVKAHDAGARQVSETVEQADEEDLDLDQREAALHVRMRSGSGLGLGLGLGSEIGLGIGLGSGSGLGPRVLTHLERVSRLAQYV